MDHRRCDALLRCIGQLFGSLPSLLVFLLSMRDDVHQVLVVQVSGYIWREGCPHLLHLDRGEQNTSRRKM